MMRWTMREAEACYGVAFGAVGSGEGVEDFGPLLLAPAPAYWG
jgi:hypothetical protein